LYGTVRIETPFKNFIQMPLNSTINKMECSTILCQN
jgi:hypothetical protein